MEYKYGLRRWLLVDEWTSHNGKRSYTIIGRFWTEAGAKFRHWWLSALLRPRSGQAAILLHDQKTDHVAKLSTQ